MFQPDFKAFAELAEVYPRVPVYLELLMDFETPPSAYLKVAGGPFTGLLESVAGSEQVARYSFVFCQPELILRTRDRTVEEVKGDDLQRFELPEGQDPLHLLETRVEARRAPRLPGLPDFAGGAVGYLGYDTVRFFERLPETAERDLDYWDTYFAFYDTLIIFDHYRHVLQLVHNADTSQGAKPAYDAAYARLSALAETLATRKLEATPLAPLQQEGHLIASNLTQAEYEEKVHRAKEYIKAGDLIQVVLSQRFEREFSGDTFALYRALRALNPSPYMYYLDCGDTILAGASPEVLVTVKEGKVRVRPIAGTRPRGATPEDDEALETELLADEKERAEHLMLVDLGRNDVGRVAEYGSVVVPDLFTIERYSHVMHLVSEVQGRLRADCSEYDALRACFPAGTVTGAPKVRAMEIIEELEPVRRGPYAGAVGYFSYSGGLDTCITIRTLVAKDGKLYGQAGAGIVADSKPEREYAETLQKAKALFAAIEMAEGGAGE